MRWSAGSLEDFYLPVLHREYYLSCCSISSSAPTRKEEERFHWRKGRIRACSPWWPSTLSVGSPSWLLGCTHPAPGPAGELRAIEGSCLQRCVHGVRSLLGWHPALHPKRLNHFSSQTYVLCCVCCVTATLPCVLQAVWCGCRRPQRGGFKSERPCLRVGAWAQRGPKDGEGSREWRLAAGSLGGRRDAVNWTPQRWCDFTLLQEESDWSTNTLIKTSVFLSLWQCSNGDFNWFRGAF